LAGESALLVEDHAGEPLRAGDSIVIPAGSSHGLSECSGDLELLEVSLPAELSCTQEK